MKVLMLGWEFPPFIAGGLGTACYGLTRAMNGLGVDVLFVLPRPVVAHGANGEAHHNGAENGRAHVKSESGTVAMVGAAYGFVHAQQAASVAAEGADCAGTVETEATGNTGGTPVPRTRMAYMDYNVDEFAHVTFRTLDAMLSPYLSPEEYRQQVMLRERRAEQLEAEAAEDVARRESERSGVPEADFAAVATAPTEAKPVPHEIVGVIREVPLPTARQMQSRIEQAAKEHARRQEPGHRAAGAEPVIGQSMLIPPRTTYAVDLMGETKRYATLVGGIAQEETFDVIHAHDWMTFRAGIAAKAISGRPLIVHVHSTEYDRNPHKPDPAVIAIETEGLEAADLVIAVSHMTRRLLVTRYGVDEEKMVVVHNAIDGNQLPGTPPAEFPVRKDEKIVLFLGRITAQKGPEYFLAAARKVLDVYEPVKFIMAGAGDLMKPTIELAAAMGIGHKVLFTGFLNARDVEKIYQMADLYVMPSVSEPFGIAPLEALSHNVPVIVSKQSGVAEILRHALKVDFWDIDALADRILAVLRHAPLASTLREHALEEVRKLSWVDAVRKVLEIYEGMAEEPVGV